MYVRNVISAIALHWSLDIIIIKKNKQKKLHYNGLEENNGTYHLVACAVVWLNDG